MLGSPDVLILRAGKGETSMERAFIKWWVPETGERGEMPKKNMQNCIREWGLKAKEVLEETGAEHVVYATKLLDKDGDVEEIRFYIKPMSDDELDQASFLYDHIYALHRLVA